MNWEAGSRRSLWPFPVESDVEPSLPGSLDPFHLPDPETSCAFDAEPGKGLANAMLQDDLSEYEPLNSNVGVTVNDPSNALIDPPDAAGG